MAVDLDVGHREGDVGRAPGESEAAAVADGQRIDWASMSVTGSEDR
jgi:hypothetical protein